jgi:hypothetical protein
MSPPPLVAYPHPLDAAYSSVAWHHAGEGVFFSNAPALALAVSDGSVPKGRAVFPFTMPCLPEERGRPECVLDPADGVYKIQVRDGATPVPGQPATRGHFCPVSVSPCPVYSSGIVRFGNAIAYAAAALMT